MRRAVFPGSFDPITLGHKDILDRSIKIFDEVIIAVGNNSNKKYMFELEKRIEFIQKTALESSSFTITSYSGLTVEFCKKSKANFLIRGLRNPNDFEFEKAIAHTNRKLSGIETVFLLTSAKTAFISSSLVREIISNKGDHSSFVPPGILT